MIGHAFMGRAHASAWRQAAHFFPLERTPELRVLCGTHAESLARDATKLGFHDWSTSWEEVVARDDVDLVDICVPGDLHPEVAIAAARNGKAILCEKPLANTLAEARSMRDAAAAAGVPNMVCYNYRRVPAVALARQLITEGRIGQIRHFRGAYLQDWIVDAAFPRVWRLERKRAGSGALGDIGSHVADLARFLVGEIAEVSAQLTTFVTERPAPDDRDTLLPVDVDDAAIALLRFESGAIGTLEATRFATGRRNALDFEISGSMGSIAWNLERLNELQLYIEEGAESGFRTILVTDGSHPYMSAWWPPGHTIGWEHTFTHVVADFVSAIASGKPASPDFGDAVRSQAVLDAVERSFETRRWAACEDHA